MTTAPGFRVEPVTSLVDLLVFESREKASTAAAGLLAGQLKTTLGLNGQRAASLVVSGGSTPGMCFDRLSREALEWSNVTVIPSDERWVPAEDPDSNEGLIRSRLLQKQANKASVLPFYRAGIEAVQAPSLIEKDLADLPRPFSATLLGMGEDGHFASLFPDLTDLQKALDPQGRAQCIKVQTGGSPHLRISLTLSAILDSAQIVLLIFGESKLQVYEAAKSGDGRYPVESLLRLARRPLTVVWAP